MTYTISEQVTLPSRGEIYGVAINPDITLRSMTGEEEMKRLSPSEKPYKTLCEIIDDCMIDKPGISSYDMCMGDFQYLLYKLRIATYGADYNSISKCPACGSENEEVIDLDRLKIREYDAALDVTRQFTLPKSGKEISLKIQTPRLLDKIIGEIKDYKKKSNLQLDPSIIVTCANIIDTIDGEKLNPAKMLDFVKKLPMADINVITQYSDKFTESVGIDNRIQHICDICGSYYESQMRTDSEFFRPSIRFGW